MKKAIASVLQSILVLLILIPTIAHGQTTVIVDELKYTLDSKTRTATVTGPANRETVINNLVIPEKITSENIEYTVTKIFNGAFDSNKNISGSLTLPNTITDIQSNAFKDCAGLTGTLRIPPSVKVIGSYAFGRCTGFTGSLIIPESVTDIGSWAFFACSGFDGELIIGNSVKKIGASTFAYCKNFTNSLILPNSLNGIGDSAFKNCMGFNGFLELGNSITSISNYAFQGCSGFKGNLKLPKSLVELGIYAFDGCSGFNGTLTIDASISIINAYTFRDCSGFTGELKLPDTIVRIGAYSFQNCSSFNSKLHLGNSITKIDGYAFQNCSGFIGALDIPESIIELGEGVFSNCSGFNGNITIGNSITKIGSSAFSDCSGLTGSLVIPESVIELGRFAFSNCTNLNGILEIKSPITQIYDYMFHNCTGLIGNLKIPKTVTKIGAAAFTNCAGFSGDLVIPESVTDIGNAAFEGCFGFNGSLRLSNNIKSIGHSAFSGCSGLSGSLNIPSSVTEISSGTFFRCSGFSGELIIPETVTDIGLAAFRECSGFTGPLIIPSNVISIGSFAFCGCTGFSDSITIPSSVKEIGELTFWCDGEISRINCYASTPPKNISKSFYSSLYKNARLFVPAESISLYRNAKDWEDFSYIKALGDNSPDKIALNEFEITIAIGNTFTLNATISPENADDKSVIWSTSDNNIASIDANGTVTGISVGKATITATASSGVNASCKVTVVEVPASAITIDMEALGITDGNLEMRVGDSKTIPIKIEPANTTDKSLRYRSSSPGIAKIDENGKITALHPGKTTITVIATSGVSAKLNVLVIETPASSISLNNTEATLKVSETIDLVATILPETTTDKSVTWKSSDESVATVDANGKITAVGVGSTTITATAKSGVTATCEIIVAETPVTGIVIDWDALGISGDNLKMEVGETKTVKVTVEPETATDKSITFKSLSPKVATVNADGEITAIAIGQCTITVTAASGVSANININVIPTAAEIIKLNHTYVSLETSETIALIATILPENTTDKSVAWSSSDENVATVDALGTVTGVTAGKAVITASTTNGVTAKCTVTVVSKATAIGDVTEDAYVKVSVADGAIVVTAPVGETVTVYNISGMCVAETKEHRIAGLTPGIYLVRVADRTFKVAL